MEPKDGKTLAEHRHRSKQRKRRGNGTFLWVWVSPISLQVVSDAFLASLCTFILYRYSLTVNTVGIMGEEPEEHAASGFWFKYPVSSRFSLVMICNFSK